jgi:amino acid permease
VAVLAVLAVVTAFLAWRQSSLNWLLVHLAIDACLGWYLAMVAQLRQRQAQKAANRYFSGGRDWDDSRVRVVGDR